MFSTVIDPDPQTSTCTPNADFNYICKCQEGALQILALTRISDKKLENIMCLEDRGKKTAELNTSNINILSLISGDKIFNKINYGSEYYKLDSRYGRIIIFYVI
jgi:hypothetical protein